MRNTPTDTPFRENFRGDARRVGVEIELAGLDLLDISDLVQREFGGRTIIRNEFEVEIADSQLGTFGVEFDSEPLKQLARYVVESRNRPALRVWTKDLLFRALDLVLPYEIVTPPLLLDELAKLESLVETLAEEGAEGTHKSAWYAFGVQYNPDVPVLEAASFLRFIQAFIVFHGWLEAREQTVLLRKLTRFVEHYPSEYRHLVTRADYRPEMGTLIDDYLRFSPTRNRALDLLPLFSFVDAGRVREAVGDPRIKARPTFHYRLPNSGIGEPEWKLMPSWCDWLQVEWLAADADRLQQAVERYHELLAANEEGHWQTECTKWLHDRS